MSKGMGTRKTLWIIGSVIAAVILALSIWAVIAAQQSESEPDPYTANDTQTEQASDTPAVAEEPDVDVEEAPAPTLDPATVSTVDIEPLAIRVSYVKGIPGFEYSIKRTQSGVEYVDFSSPQLVGTKCTDDTGVFASIIKNPESDGDRSTLTSTTKVGADSYGLSLPADTCTADPAQFAAFQSSFKDAFGLLSAIDGSTDN